MIDAKNLESRQLETRDLDDSLLFVLKSNPRWGNLIAGLAVIAVFAFVAWRWHNVIFLVFVVVALLGLVSNRRRGRQTTLRVSRAQVVAHGNLESSSTADITIPLDGITSMGWSAGGQDDNGGLYVANGWTRSYVVPGATEAQAREIIATITGKFPGFLIDDKTWASLIWGDESVLTDLGLDEENPGEGSRSGNS